MEGSSLLRTALSAWNLDWMGFRVEDKLISLVCFNLICSILWGANCVSLEKKRESSSGKGEKQRSKEDLPQHE